MQITGLRASEKPSHSSAIHFFPELMDGKPTSQPNEKHRFVTKSEISQERSRKFRKARFDAVDVSSHGIVIISLSSSVALTLRKK
jgi:hypothetical protein